MMALSDTDNGRVPEARASLITALASGCSLPSCNPAALAKISGNGGKMGGHMMGPMMDWNGMSPYYSKLTPEQLKQRQYMMEQYMGMQQNMMNQMMQQNYIWMDQPKK